MGHQPERGGQPIILAIFYQSLHEIEKKMDREGARPKRLLRSTNGIFSYHLTLMRPIVAGAQWRMRSVMEAEPGAQCPSSEERRACKVEYDPVTGVILD